MYKVGDVVFANGYGDMVVAEARAIRKGRAAGQMEYALAPLPGVKLTKNAYGLRATGERHLGPAKGTYTPEAIAEAVEKHTGTKMDIAERKEASADKGRDAIAALHVQPGMIVTIRYSDVGPRDEECVAVNEATGKVGIKKRDGSTRWVSARLVAGSKYQERPLPYAVSDKAFAKLLESGWAQMRFGREFIERSCVVAFAPADAKRGTDYECASQVVYHDPALDIFWRETGSFDRDTNTNRRSAK